MKPITGPSMRSSDNLNEMSLTRRGLLGASSAAWAVAVLPGTLHAQSTYPSKAVTLIVPNPPGGNTDILARIFRCRWPRHSASPWSWTTAQGLGV